MANKNESKSLLGKIWRIKWWLLSIFTVLFLLFALFFPLNNYYVELPGGAFDTKEVLTVDKKADDSKGSYNFVAVAQTKATLALMLYAQLNDFAKLQTAEEATGNYSDEDFMRINQFYMEMIIDCHSLIHFPVHVNGKVWNNKNRTTGTIQHGLRGKHIPASNDQGSSDLLQDQHCRRRCRCMCPNQRSHSLRRGSWRS